jgi:hypothetical protein
MSVFNSEWSHLNIIAIVLVFAVTGQFAAGLLCRKGRNKVQ